MGGRGEQLRCVRVLGRNIMQGAAWRGRGCVERGTVCGEGDRVVCGEGDRVWRGGSCVERVCVERGTLH